MLKQLDSVTIKHFFFLFFTKAGVFDIHLLKPWMKRNIVSVCTFLQSEDFLMTSVWTQVF